MPAYDCTQIIIAAIHRAIQANGGNMPTRQQVLDQMSKTDYTGALGHTSFGDKGDTTNTVATVYEAKGTPVDWASVKDCDYTNCLSALAEGGRAAAPSPLRHGSDRAGRSRQT